MTKKKLVLAITSAAMIMAVTIGGTLAYFTDRDEATNVITMGNVQIELNERMIGPQGETEYNRNMTNVKPGDDVSKIPYVTNTSTLNAAYIRVLVQITNPAGAPSTNLLTIANLDVDRTVWDIVAVPDAADGVSQWYCYLRTPLAAGVTAPAVFRTVHIPEQWGNTVANQSFDIVVTAEAIQADGFTPTTNAEGIITGWFYSDNTPISVDDYVAPSAAPSAQPSAAPSVEPSAQPSAAPSVEPGV